MEPEQPAGRSSMPSAAGVGVRRRKAANFLAELGGAEIESPHHGEAPSGWHVPAELPAFVAGLHSQSGAPCCCRSGSTRLTARTSCVGGSSSRRVVSRSRSSCCRSLWSRASSSSWPTSATGACRPAARPPASTRPGSGGAARAPPKPVAPLSVERLVAGSPRREPGRSKPLSYQLRAPNSS